MIEDSEESRKAAALFSSEHELQYENVVRFCAHCDEEYQLPEDMEKCPLCENPLHDEE